MRKILADLLAWWQKSTGPGVIVDPAGRKLVYGRMFKRPRVIDTPGAARLLQCAALFRLVSCLIALVICIFLLAVTTGHFETSNPMILLKVLSSLAVAVILAGFAIYEIMTFYLPSVTDAPDKRERASVENSLVRLIVCFALDIGVAVLVSLGIDVRRDFYGDLVWLMAPDVVFVIIMLVVAWDEFRAILTKLGVGRSTPQTH